MTSMAQVVGHQELPMHSARSVVRDTINVNIQLLIQPDVPMFDGK
jgi:hypothetical protein